MSGLSEHRGVWVFSENKELLLELLGQGSELAKNLQTDVTAVALGSGVGSQANELVAHGANKVYVVDHP
ncbi:MAG: electron transfer flavoprotein subunit alpha, partial [candidate division Zixibacteria bacterium]|nr:electron transfer flavoprotein subunit alpha [candidate division Zixibacteria bacterium]